jgi:hypothetical protein
MAKMERDSFERVIAGKSAFDAVATLDTKPSNPLNSWEAKISDGCSDPYTQTVVGLKSVNGRNGPQAGA